MPEVDVDALVKEHLSNWRELSKKYFPDSPDLTLVVLKGHLIIEQQITALICHYCPSPHYIAEARLSLSQKVSLARALLVIPVPAQLWDVLRVINSLRNDLAHNLEPPKLERHVASARAIAQQIADEKALSSQRQDLDGDVGVLRYLVGFAHGCLQVADSCVAVMETQRKYA